eukprot:4371907-Prorocentrum_lima.AAC.1
MRGTKLGSNRQNALGGMPDDHRRASARPMPWPPCPHLAYPPRRVAHVLGSRCHLASIHVGRGR